MQIYTIHDDQHLSIDLLDYGARVAGIQFQNTELACRYQQLAQYQADTLYLGASVGPIANRIQNGQFRLADQLQQMATNDGANTLHSGGNGLDKQTWQCLVQTPSQVIFALDYDMSCAGLLGFLRVRANYQVSAGCLKVSYQSACDQATYLNLTNHVYLNLSGRNQSIKDHDFVLFADNFVAVDQNNIPTGQLNPVPNPFEYNIERRSPFPELQGHCDHHFNVGEAEGFQLKRMLSAISSTSGIALDVYGNSPGFQFYTGESMSTPFTASGGFCVETQYAPDAINQATFFSPILAPNQVLIQTTEYRFRR